MKKTAAKPLTTHIASSLIDSLDRQGVLAPADIKRLRQIAEALDRTEQSADIAALLPLLFGGNQDAAQLDGAWRKFLNRVRQLQADAVADGSLPAGNVLELKASRKTTANPTPRVQLLGTAQLQAQARTHDLEGTPFQLDPTGIDPRLLGQTSAEEAPILLTTVNEHETAALRYVFKQHTGKDSTPFTVDGYPYEHLGYSERRPIIAYRSQMGSVRNGAALLRTTKALQHHKASVVISVGIAFGRKPLPPKTGQKLGDVLIAEHVTSYESGRLNKDGSSTPRSESESATASWLECSTQVPIEGIHRIKGQLLCGEKLVDNAKFRKQLDATFPRNIGGDMESFGVAQACKANKTDWIVIKAVSDWGDGTKAASSDAEHEQLQRRAALNAAKVAFSAIYLKLPRDLQDETFIHAKPPLVPTHAAPQPLCLDAHVKDYDNVPELLELKGERQSLRSTLTAAPAPQEQPRASHAKTVQDSLVEWLQNDDAPPIFALLGEYGMGKTVSCQRLYQYLRQLRQKGEALDWAREPLYFDLRQLSLFKNQDRHGVIALPSAQHMVDDLITHGWVRTKEHKQANFADVQTLLEQGALLIVDGLDECLVHLTEAQHPQFVNTWLQLLADALNAAKLVKPRLLTSCRTNFFKTLSDQRNMLTSQHRGMQNADWFESLQLLPLTEAQIEQYLQAVLPGLDMVRVKDLIAHTHNLGELAERPMTLKLLGEHIPELEAMRSRGEIVNGAALYELVVRKWLERDAGKHHLAPEHKLRLMPALAAHMWMQGVRSLGYEELHAWFHLWRDTQPDMAARYAPAAYNQTKLEEDLRTATFVVREDESEQTNEGFRFAHSSMAEFFLAQYLSQAVLTDEPTRWAMPLPSRETLHFLGELLQLAQHKRQRSQPKQAALTDTLNTWRSTYRAQASELLLRYALVAPDSAPRPLLAGFNLRGAQLRGWRFGPPAPSQALLPMQGCRLEGADLRETRFERVRLDDARFDQAQLAQASFVHCNADRSHWACADLTASAFRHTTLNNAQWAPMGSAYHAQWIACPGLPDDSPPHQSPHTWHTASLNQRGPDTRCQLMDLDGHSGSVTSVAFSPDGLRIASGSVDNTLRLWDAASGQCLMTLAGHEGSVASVAFSPDGQRIASGSYDNTLRLWDAASGQCLLTLEDHENSVASVAFSPDGLRIASGSGDNTLRVWDADSGQCLLTLEGHTKRLTSVAFSPDGQRIASGSHDNTLRLWDAVSGQCLMTLEGHEGSVTRVAFSPDGRRIASGSHDNTLRVWDAASGQCLLTLEGHTQRLTSVAFSPDGLRIASGSGDNMLRLWDADSGQCLLTLEGHEGSVASVAFSPDGRHIASGSGDNTLRLWNADSGQCLLTLEGHEGSVASVAFSPDGQHIASGSGDNTLRLWDAASGLCVLTLAGHTKRLTSVAFSPNGQRIASGSWDNTLRVWNADSGQCLLTLEGHADWVTSVAFSPDGQRIASGSYDNTLRLWDADSGQCLLTLESHTKRVTSVAFSPDGLRIVSGSGSGDSTLRLWDAANGQCLMTLEGHEGSITGVAFSPDGLHIAAGSDDATLRVWNADSGQCLLTLEGHKGSINSVAFSPDGLRIASASSDNTLHLWDAASGQTIHIMKGHTDWGACVAFAPDGQRIASGSWDNTLRLWDAASGQCLRVHWVRQDANLQGHAVWRPAAGLGASDGGELLHASGDAWRVLGWRVWDHPQAPGQWIRVPLGPYPTQA